MRKIVILVLLLAGCKDVPMLPGLGPHKIDIQQGNYVTQQMVAKLKPGMTRAQVRFVLGTPLVVDMFRNDRWDYVYVYQKQGTVTEHRKMTVVFQDDKLARVEGDVVPASSAGAAADKPKPDASPPSPKPAPGEAPPKSDAAPPPPKAQASKPEGSVLTTTTGAPVTSGPPPADAAKPEPKAEQPAEAKPSEERGFFGRMLDKIGF
jgi:outer membrane protein assembly factor BamE